MSGQVNLKGMAELQKFLTALPVNVEKKILRSSLSAGATVIKNEAKKLVPVRDGGLKKSIRVSSKATKKGQVTATAKATAPHAHLVEFGTKPHLIAAQNRSLEIGGQLVGPVVHHPGAKPHPFMRRAMDTKTKEALTAVANRIKERLTKEGLSGAADVEAGAA